MTVTPALVSACTTFVLAMHEQCSYMLYYTYTDIKECEIGTNNCSQQCIELPGGFECSCDDGYQLQLDNITCEGIYFNSLKHSNKTYTTCMF